MIKVINGSLFDFIHQEQIDTVINAANGVGIMGAGIAGAIKKYGGKEVQTHALQMCRELDPKEGESYITISGNLLSKGVTQIIHAVTMKEPGGYTSYKIVESALQSSFSDAISVGSKKIACPGIGTGIGGLDPVKVADVMYNVAINFAGKFDIIFIDLKKEFTDRIGELINISLCIKK